MENKSLCLLLTISLIAALPVMVFSSYPIVGRTKIDKSYCVLLLLPELQKNCEKLSKDLEYMFYAGILGTFGSLLQITFYLLLLHIFTADKSKYCICHIIVAVLLFGALILTVIVILDTKEEAKELKELSERLAAFESVALLPKLLAAPLALDIVFCIVSSILVVALAIID